MQHKKFRILSFITGFVILCSALGFDFVMKYYNREILGLKMIPISMVILLNLSHIYIYDISVYSGLMNFIFLFCLTGDICLGVKASGNELLISGGVLFLMARFFLLFALMLKNNNWAFIKYNKKSLILSHILMNIPFVITAVLFSVYLKKYLEGVYLFLGCGFQLSYAFLRISGTDEPKGSTICAFLGVLLFNLSDILLLLTFSYDSLSPLGILISDNIYWLAMFLLVNSSLKGQDDPDNENVLI